MSRRLALAAVTALTAAALSGCAPSRVATAPASTRPASTGAAARTGATPAGTARASGPSPQDAYPGGLLLGDGLSTVPGTRLAGPLGQTGAGPVHAWYATLLLQPGAAASDVVAALGAQLRTAGYAVTGAGGQLTGRRSGPVVVTAQVAGADAVGPAPGFVRVIVTTTPAG